MARMKNTAFLLPVGPGQGDGDASFGLGKFRINDSTRLVKQRTSYGRDGEQGRTQGKEESNSLDIKDTSQIFSRGLS